MATVEELLSLSQSLDEPRKIDIIDVNTSPTFGDYIADIVRAPVGGVLDAVEGLLRLGAIPVDLALDTNSSRAIQKFFDKWAPNAKTGIGEGVQVFTQYASGLVGGPLLAASLAKNAALAPSIIRGMSVLKGAKLRKLSDPELVTLGAKGLELAKRAGYFGATGGVLDLAVSRPGSQQTLSEAVGLTESKNLDELEGRERAVEELKQRLKFGAEGAVIGGGITLLPAAGTLGYKYGLSPVAKVATPVIGKALTVLDKTVINPLAVTIAGKGTKPLIADLAQRGGKLLDVAYDKTGLPPVSKWKEFDPDTGTFTEKILKKIDNVKQQFTVAGKSQFPEVKQLQTQVESAANAEVKSLKRISERINDRLYNIVSKFKTNIYDVATYKATRTGNYTNIMDQLTAEKNKIFDFIRASGREEIKRTLKEINPAVRLEAKQLKQILKKSNSRYGNLLAKNPIDSLEDLSLALRDQADSFFKQRFAAFNNKKFQYDPISGPIGSKALAAVKNVVRKNPDYMEGVVKKTQKDVGTQGVFTPEYKVAYDKALAKNLNDFSEDLLKNIQQASIRAGIDPDNYVRRVANILRTDEVIKPSLKPGETFPDAIKRFLNQEKNAKVVTKDYENALVDTVMYQAKQFYSKNYFDGVEKILASKGALFNKLQSDIGKNVAPIMAYTNKGSLVNPKKDVMFKSSLFREGDETLYTYPEIANALSETKVAFDNFFDFPLYKSLMSLKAGAQVAKTIFSPMTQIRNVTTASFFPLMSGLIGGRTSLSDSWKLVAEDIFTGAKTNLAKLNDEIEDMIKRGVIDQNIEVNEIRAILNRAKDGAISFESFMNAPTVKKFVDVYQGGDNLWKVYSDKFYQSALRQALGDPKATPDQVLANVKDWYRTIAKEDFVENSIFTGQKKTAEEALKEVSAYLVTNTIPTYSKVPLAIQSIRRLPIGNFVAFPAEILRTTSNVLTIGARELTSTNPYIRQMGARRIIGASATLGGIGKVVSETAQYVTGVDQNQMDAAKRSFVPIYERNATLIPLSKADADGKFKYFNFSYSNPYDSLVRPFNAILGAFAEGSLNKDSVDQKILASLFGDPVSKRPGALSEFFAPFVTESIGTERVFDLIIRNGETRNGSKIWFPQDNLQTRIAKGIDHIMGGLAPGAYTQAARVWEGATGTFTDAGTARNTRDELLAMMSGIRVQEVKPLSSMPFILTSYNKDKQNVGSKFARTAYSAASTPEEKISAFKDYLLESFDSQQKMYTTLRDAENLGISTRELRKILEERLTKSDARLLLRGEFKPPAYSDERFKSLIKRLETEDPNAAFLFEDNIDVIKDIFDDLRKDSSRYDLEDSKNSLEQLINEILTPEVPEVRNLPLRPIKGTGTTAQAPNLPSQISGTPVNTGIISNQNLGQQFGLNQTEKTIEQLRKFGMDF